MAKDITSVDAWVKCDRLQKQALVVKLCDELKIPAPEQPKYEYHIESQLPSSDAIQRLNELGEEGWELISPTSVTQNTASLFGSILGASGTVGPMTFKRIKS